MKRSGFFGIGISHGKTPENLGTLWRTAHILGADFVFTIGRRYTRDVADVTNATKQLPYWRFDDLDQFLSVKPCDALLVGVEMHQSAQMLGQFEHPKRAVYLLGAEDNGLQRKEMEACNALIRLPGKASVNVAVAGSVVLFDRIRQLPHHQ